MKNQSLRHLGLMKVRQKWDDDKPSFLVGKRLASGFCIIARRDIDVRTLKNSQEFQQDDELVVTAHFKDVENVEDKERLAGISGGTVNLEVITAASIQSWLKESHAFDLASCHGTQDLEIGGCGLVRFWAMRVRSFYTFWHSWVFLLSFLVDATGCANDPKMVS